MNKLALSTAFLIDSAAEISGKEIVREGVDLGFPALELNIEITSGMIGEIREEVAKKKIKISSLHNFCPKLGNIPQGRDLLTACQFSSTEPEERKKAVELTKRTIDHAADLSAEAVVVHAGEVEIELNEAKLFSQFVRGKTGRDYPEKVREEREERKKIYLENSFRSMEEIVKYAEKKKVKIGLENRFFYHEIPGFEEIGIFLRNFGGDYFGYWHDTGHAEIWTRLGFPQSHEAYFRSYASGIIGVHLHDVVGLSDHRAPGCGEVDFSRFAKYLDSGVIKVVEAHRFSTPAEVKASIAYLHKAGIN